MKVDSSKASATRALKETQIWKQTQSRGAKALVATCKLPCSEGQLPQALPGGVCTTQVPWFKGHDLLFWWLKVGRSLQTCIWLRHFCHYSRRQSRPQCPRPPPPLPQTPPPPSARSHCPSLLINSALRPQANWKRKIWGGANILGLQVETPTYCIQSSSLYAMLGITCNQEQSRQQFPAPPPPSPCFPWAPCHHLLCRWLGAPG